MDAAACALLGPLFRYPRPGYAEEAGKVAARLAAACPAAVARLRPFAAWAAGLPPGELEELFTRTFDHDQAAALEAGWHVHGENYARGALLVQVRCLLRAQGLAEHGELPDHLGNLLPLLGRLPASEAIELAEDVARPALKKIAVALAAAASPFEGLVDAALAALGPPRTSPLGVS